MPTPDPRLLSLSTLLLAGVLLGVPWAAGGRSPLGQVGLVLPVMLAAAIGLLPRGHPPRLRPSPLLLSGGILAAVSAFHTIYPDRTVHSLLLLLAYALAGTLAAHGAREVSWGEPLLLTAVLTSGVLITGLGMVPLIRGGTGGMYAGLLTGPFGYPNALAGYLLLTGGAALAMLRAGRGLWHRVSGGAALLLGGMGLWLTRSRGALLAAFVGIILWAALERHTWWPRRRLWISVGAIALVTLLLWAPRSPIGALSSLLGLGTQPQDTSVTWRQQILQWTWIMARENAWWGVGPGAFPVALTHFQGIPYVSGENPHNLYLELAAEYGLLAALLAVVLLGGFLVRVGHALARTPPEDSRRRGGAALLAALVAFFVHNLGDLDWSFPAIAVTATTLLGLTATRLLRKPIHRPGTHPVWRRALILLLAVAALASLTRFYAITLVTWGRYALAAGDVMSARRDLTWALRLNPWSFPAHQWMAWVRLRSDDPRGAIEVAERAARLAPLDPNSQFLAGEIAASVGRWDLAEERFRAAVDRSSSAQLRFHAGLVEAAARAGRATEARLGYERAVAIFTPARVLEREARCLAPGDRYLLARMSRIAARLYGEAGDTASQLATAEEARVLAQPDRRGICGISGRAGQESPEAVTESFWRARAGGGWPLAEQFLAPGYRGSPHEQPGVVEDGHALPRRVQVSWIAALQADERQARLRYEIDVELPFGRRIARCANGAARLAGDRWYLTEVPGIEQEPCRR
ncbi:MAG TPA: O-antigen ligase family protein [Candidatus Methylomirabilis sp.]|nr:O-antigen ligase family protein [Candidatus Methylomirabilis sp.]